MKINKTILKKIIKETISPVAGLPRIPDDVNYLLRSKSVFLEDLRNEIISFRFKSTFKFPANATNPKPYTVELQAKCTVSIKQPNNPTFEVINISGVPESQKQKKSDACIRTLSKSDGKFYREFMNEDVLNYIIIANNVSTSPHMPKFKSAVDYLKSETFQQWRNSKKI